LISLQLVLAMRAWNGELTSIVVWAFMLTLRLFRVVPGAVLIIESLIGASVTIFRDPFENFLSIGTVEGVIDSRTSILSSLMYLTYFAAVFSLLIVFA